MKEGAKVLEVGVPFLTSARWRRGALLGVARAGPKELVDCDLPWDGGVGVDGGRFGDDKRADLGLPPATGVGPGEGEAFR